MKVWQSVVIGSPAWECRGMQHARRTPVTGIGPSLLRCVCWFLHQVAKEDLKRRRFAFEKQGPQRQQPAMGADHDSCSKLVVPDSARRLHGKTLVRIPLPPPVSGVTQAASLHVGLPYIVDPAAPSPGASVNSLQCVSICTRSVTCTVARKTCVVASNWAHTCNSRCGGNYGEGTPLMHRIG